jgi:glycosyltransferase involved in cell wall biosynthesis
MPEKTGVLFLHSQEGFGAESQIHASLMRHLDREQFEVHVACTPGDGPEVPESLAKLRGIPGIHVRPTRFLPGFHHRSREEVLRGVRAGVTSPADFVGLARYVRRHRIRIIHGTDRPRDAVYGVVLSRLTGAKSVAHVHVRWSREYSAAAVWAVGRADAAFGISEFVSRSIAATGTPPGRIHTILNAIESARWDPAAVDGGAIRRELGVPEEAPLLASVSRLFGQKGQRELLRALARVKDDVPDVRLLVVGADTLAVHGGSFTAELKALAGELGIAERVVFTGQRTDIAAIMAACDVFTLPSFEEPFGLVYLEAMAMKRPVVSLDNGGTPEVVEHGRSGLLSPAGDIEALAGNIRTLLQNPRMRAEMGAYGRSRVLDFFNAERMARDAGAAYRKVLGA